MNRSTGVLFASGIAPCLNYTMQSPVRSDSAEPPQYFSLSVWLLSEEYTTPAMPPQHQNDEGEHQQQGHQQDEHNPATTLVQTIGTRPYRTVRTTLNQIPTAILKFPRGLTLFMSPFSPLFPATTGEAQLDVHRKFLSTYGKFLHWITFTFPGSRVQAQILIPRRLGAAYNMVRGGSAAVFVKSPLQRRRRVNNKRRAITIR